MEMYGILRAAMRLVGLVQKARKARHRAQENVRAKWSDTWGHLAQHHPSGSGTPYWATDLIERLRAERMATA